MVKILGLDIATCTGYALLEKNKLLAKGKYKLKSKDLGNRLVEISYFAQELFDKYEPKVLIVESVYLKKFQGKNNPKVTALLNKYQGAIVSNLPDSCIFEEVTTTSVRSKVLPGKGRYSKQDVFNWAVNEYNLENFIFSRHNDITDAIVLAKYGELKYASKRTRRSSK